MALGPAGERCSAPVAAGAGAGRLPALAQPRRSVRKVLSVLLIDGV